MNIKWSYERIANAAKQFKTRTEFSRRSNAYSAAIRRGILDDVCSHMQKQ